MSHIRCVDRLCHQDTVLFKSCPSTEFKWNAKLVIKHPNVNFETWVNIHSHLTTTCTPPPSRRHEISGNARKRPDRIDTFDSSACKLSGFMRNLAVPIRICSDFFDNFSRYLIPHQPSLIFGVFKKMLNNAAQHRSFCISKFHTFIMRSTLTLYRQPPRPFYSSLITHINTHNYI